MAFSSRKVLSLAVLGCVMAACSSKAQAPQSLILNDFERVPDPALARREFDPAEALKKPMYPAHDFDVSTSGYATLSPIDKAAARAAKDKPLYKFIVGQTAGKVRFSVPGDYKKKGDEHFPLQWESGLTLSIDSQTPLKATDWSKFGYLAVPVFNPGPLTQTVQLRVTDSGSAMTQTSALAPLGEAVLEFPLLMLSDARLNAADIKGMTLFIDTAGQDKDPVLIFDQIGLYSLTVQERAKLAQEEGEQSDDEDDWDSEDEDVVRRVPVMRPGQTAPLSDASADSGTAKAQ
jgi:hypothetical protein